MNINIDYIIFIGFLIINLLVGIWSGRGIKNIKEYAIGNRNFNTSTLAATVVATSIGGNFFATGVSGTYKEGLWYAAFAGAGDLCAFVVTAVFLAPRIKEFFESISVAEVMGKLYGDKIRVVTAFCSIANAIGITALQIKVFSAVFSHFLGMSILSSTLISSFVVTTYSAMGGIRAVTFTDVLQFITFGVCIPILAVFVWQAYGDSESISQTFHNNPNFDFKELINYNNPKFFPSLFLLLLFSIPSINASMFQRILMAKNTEQVRHSFLVGAGVITVLRLMSVFIAIVVLTHNPNLPPNNVAMYVIDNYAFTGLKGMAIVGLMAMIMSTADSWINTGAVIFAHDFCKPIGIKFKNELLVSRIFAVFAGIFGVILALSAADLLELLLLQGKFYKPIVIPSLLLAILGFRSTTKSVAIGMIAGAASVIIWLFIITPYNKIDGIVPSAFTNLIAFIGAHYLLRQPGGWIKTYNPSNSYRPKSKSLREKVLAFSIFKDGLLKYCSKQTPKNDIVYPYFAFATLFTIVVTFTLKKEIYINNFAIITLIQAITLLIATIFFCNKLWPSKFREKYMGLTWYISIFSVLSFNSCFLVLITNSSQTSLIMYILSLTMIGALLNWQSSLVLSIFGVISSFVFYTLFIGDVPNVVDGIYDSKLKIWYILLIVGSFVLAFLKPRQEDQEIAEEKIDHLSHRIEEKDKEVQEALALKAEFIRNINHEYNTPITGVLSLAEALYSGYNQLSEERRKEALGVIVTSSRRLKEYDENILTLARLNKPNFKLNKEILNLGELLYERVNSCRKLYDANKNEREFTINIDDNIALNADKSYIMQLIDNLIINAIRYCERGKIQITLTKKDSKLELIIEDEGIGIPSAELQYIFEAFVVSSRTKTFAGGRGVGLSVAKRIVEVHGGSITAESTGKTGAIFKVVLPI